MWLCMWFWCVYMFVEIGVSICVCVETGVSICVCSEIGVYICVWRLCVLRCVWR